MDSEGTAIFATDTILAHLMTCTRSVNPWDIVVTKAGSKLFFDKRDNSTFGNPKKKKKRTTKWLQIFVFCF
jgi:hypothetical protein